MKTTIYRYSSPAHLIAIIFFLQVLDYHYTVAQRYLTTFGRIEDFRTGNHTRAVLTGDFNGDSNVDLALVGDREVSVRYQDTDGWRINSFSVERLIIGAATGKFNRDKRDDFLIILDNPPEARVYLSTSIERFVRVWEHRLPSAPEHVQVADINSDGLPDLLFFGKKQLGITVYLGLGNGGFRRDTTILAENSFSSLLVCNINGDRLNDLIGTNWISNGLMIFTGFGRLRFSDPQIITGSSEPKIFQVAAIDTDAIIDLAVLYPEERLLQIFHGDGLGAFQLSQSKNLNAEPQALDIADMNSDGHPDLGILTDRSLLVELNSGHGKLEEEVEFAAGAHPVDLALIHNNHSAQVSAVVLDTANNVLRYFHSARAEVPSANEEYYGTGLLPGTILPIDFHHNGSNDLLVPNSGSRSVSLYLEKSDGGYRGQIPFESVSAVQFLRSVSITDSMLTIIGYSSVADSMAIISINTQDFSHHVLTLPTIGSTDLLYVRQDSSTGYLHLFTLEKEPKASRETFVEYEQMTATRFIERSYTQLSSEPIVAAAMTDFDRDPYPDLVYVVYDSQRHELRVNLARGTQSEQYALSRILTTIPAETSPVATLKCLDINGDHIPDLLMSVQGANTTIYTLLGKSDSTFSSPMAQLTGALSIASPDDVQFIGSSHRRRDDFLINNSLTRTLEFYHARSDGLLLPSSRVMSTEGMGGYLYCRNQRSQTTQIMVTDRHHGFLRIIALEGNQ